jgi:hypothetical protein
MPKHLISLLPAKRLLWCLSVTILATSQVHCGKCGGFVPCVPDPLLTASSLQVNFAIQDVGTASPPQTVALSATGTSASMIASITVSGDFSQTNACGKSLAPNTTCSVAVVFTPAAAGTRTGQLVLSEGVSVQIVVGLTGTGQ